MWRMKRMIAVCECSSDPIREVAAVMVQIQSEPVGAGFATHSFPVICPVPLPVVTSITLLDMHLNRSG